MLQPQPIGAVAAAMVEVEMPEPTGARGAQAWFDGMYGRLKAVAGRQRAQAGSPPTYSTTEIVHELYLRMCAERSLSFERELEFFSYAARTMRNFLVDLARKRMSLKDGGDLVKVDMTDPMVGSVSIDPAQALELDAALRVLEADSPRAAGVLELHYFAGLALDRVAEITRSSPRTVDRDWKYARAFLAARMNGTTAAS
jgi:RNA polymerase sigma factor (TIGR02999 family)